MGVGIATPAVHAASKGAEPAEPAIMQIGQSDFNLLSIRRPTPISEIARTRVARRAAESYDEAPRAVTHTRVYDRSSSRQSRTRYTPRSTRATNMFPSGVMR